MVILPKEPNTLIGKDTCTSMLTATSFIISKIQKQPKCLSTDEQIKNMWYIHNRILLIHKK